MASPSQRALVSVTAETRIFQQRLDAYVEAYGLEAGKVSRAVALKLEARLKKGTPVDTGRARNSWHTVFWGNATSYSYQDNQGRSFDGTTLAAPRGEAEAVVSTNVSYMLALEAGSSRQAPNGWIAQALHQTASELQDAVRRLPQSPGLRSKR